MNRQQAEELLDKYKAGGCSREEETLLEAWFDSQSTNSEWRWNDRERAEIKLQMKSSIDSKINRSKVRRLDRRIVLAAASVLVLVTFGIFFKIIFKKDDKRSSYVVTELIVPAGERKNIVLSDGSEVIVNSASKIKYPDKFSGETREVILSEGEAYFKVTPNKKKPFVVITKSARTEVLGTAFNIRAYHFYNSVTVTVSHGKVRVQDELKKSGSEVILLPNEQATISNTGGEILKTQGNLVSSIGWIEGKLLFNNETLANVARTLENKYNVTIRFEEQALKEYRLSAGFEDTDRLDEVLYALSRANKLEFSIKGNLVIFNKK